MGAGDTPPVAAQAPVQAAPVQAASSTPASASAAPVRTAPSRLEAETMRTAPGARESASLGNVSRVSTGSASSGSALGGTIVSGQSAGAIPSTIDRNREPPRLRASAPRDPLGPGTPPPVVAPELRDTTGRTIRNRQEVQF